MVLFCVAVMSLSDGLHDFMYCNPIRWGVHLLLQGILFAYLTEKVLFHIDSQWNAIYCFDLFESLKWYGACKELIMVIVLLPGLLRILSFLVVSEFVIWVAFVLFICSGNVVYYIWSVVLVLLWIYFFYWYFLGKEINSGVTLGSLLSSTDSTDVPEEIFSGSPACTLVSHYFVFQFIHIEPIHHGVMVKHLWHVHCMMNLWQKLTSNM